MDPILDRREPTIWKHVQKWALRSAPNVAEAFPSPSVVETVLDMPRQYAEKYYDQGEEGACVGHSESWTMSYYNREPYDAFWLYLMAQGVDEWEETPPEGGTSLSAGFDILRNIGHRRIYAGRTRPIKLETGILENRWATTVDEIRASIAVKHPVTFGINWYDSFYDPVDKPRIDRPNDRRLHDYWIGDTTYWGRVAGGHAITCVGASDKRQAFALCNTWGRSYPFIVWLPYVSALRLLNENGEAGIVTDRPKVPAVVEQ